MCLIFSMSFYVQVELTSRTGRNPQVDSCMLRMRLSQILLLLLFYCTHLQYSYLSLGCSKKAEQCMLNYARSLVGKPFSNIGMARSIVFPRHTDGTSFFCAGEPYHQALPSSLSFSIKVFTRRCNPCELAELVASVLKKGGLM